MAFFSWLRRVRSKRIPPCSAVIAAAGYSQRMGGGDKLYAEIHGMPVLAHTLTAFQACGHVSEIIVVVREDCMELAGGICEKHGIGKVSKIMVGGPTRLSSVMNGVFAVSDKAELIAIHDGARPCIEQGVIERAIEAAAKHHAAAPGVPVSSTLKKAKGGIVTETVDRDDLFEIQTPQAFKASLIKAALTSASNKSIEVTDDCRAVELIGAPVHIVEGSRGNIKITTSQDLIIAKAVLGVSGNDDPFYSLKNQARLTEAMDQLEAGLGVEHDLIEVNDD